MTTMQKISAAEAQRRPVEARQPVLLIGLGRGSSGKSTGLAEAVFRASHYGRGTIVADGDMRSKTLAGIFTDASAPPSDEPEDVKAWKTRLFNRMAKERRSAVLDLGGGDRILQDYGRDLGIVEFCEDQGIEPLAMYFLGPDAEDLKHMLSIWRGGYFRPQRTIIVLNEGVVRTGQNPAVAFERTMADAGLSEMEKAGAKLINMPKLACMDAVRLSKAGFYNIRADESFGPVEAHMLKKWLRDMEAERVRQAVADWLP